MGFGRRRLAARRRRVIYNDDGDTRYMTTGREELLGRRFTPVLSTDVDAYFWCILVCHEPWDAPGLGDANRIMIEAVVDAPPLRQGVNYVTIVPGPGCIGKPASRVENVQLWVKYQGGQ